MGGVRGAGGVRGDGGGGRKGAGGSGGAVEQEMRTSVSATSAALSVPQMASNRKVGALTATFTCLHCDTSPLVPDVLQTRRLVDVACATTCNSPQ